MFATAFVGLGLERMEICRFFLSSGLTKRGNIGSSPGEL